MWQNMIQSMAIPLVLPPPCGSFVGALLLFGALGCSKELILEPVEGTITLDGKPVADAAVLFQPLHSDGPPAHATTDDEGRFKLSTTNRSGVTAGKYRVAISKVEVRRAEQGSSEAEGNSPRSGFLDEKDLEEIYLLPSRYTDANNSVLVADVQADSRNAFTFSLTSDETVGKSDEPAESPASKEARPTESSTPSR